MLDDFIETHQEELIARARKKVALRRTPSPTTEKELKYGVPLFLKQLVAILRAHPSKGETLQEPEVGEGAKHHGRELLRMGLTVGQVVHAYGDVCQAITELAVASDTPLATADFRTLNRCLDDAIAAAVGEYVQSHDTRQSGKEAERLGELAQELRNLITTGVLAFNVLKGGTVGIAGSTGAVLGRTLNAIRELVDHSLSEVRLAGGAHHRSRFNAAEFVEEVEIAAALEADNHDVELVVDRVNFEWFIDGDRQLLASAMSNLLQHAFKATKSGGRVSLRSSANLTRIIFEVEDQGGGLARETMERLTRPLTQGKADRSGNGLGITISRKAVEANGGTLAARDLVGKGSIFTVDLPLSSSPPQSPPS